MPFLAVCPDCQYPQICVLPTNCFPKLKCSRCRIVYDPIGSEDTEIVLELAGETQARDILRRRARRAARARTATAARPHPSKAKGRRRKRALASATVSAGVDSETAAAALLELPVGEPTGLSALLDWVPETPAITQAPVPRQVPVRRRPRRGSRGDEDSDAAVVFGWLAVALAGSALTGSQFPAGWWIGLVLASLGLVLGAQAARRDLRTSTAAAAGANLIVLAILVFLPTWLGIHPSERPGSKPAPKVAQVIGLDGNTAEVGDGWVDVTAAFWQYNDVRVTAGRPVIGPARLTRPDGRTESSQRPYLIVRIHVRNSGGRRSFAVPRWPSTGADAPRLTVNGAPAAVAVFDGGREPPPPKVSQVAPNQAADVFLYFEAPAKAAGGCELELPGGPLGVPTPVRLRLPAAQ